jgi:hypothetical protein
MSECLKVVDTRRVSSPTHFEIEDFTITRDQTLTLELDKTDAEEEVAFRLDLGLDIDNDAHGLSPFLSIIGSERESGRHPVFIGFSGFGASGLTTARFSGSELSPMFIDCSARSGLQYPACHDHPAFVRADERRGLTPVRPERCTRLNVPPQPD